MLCGDFVIEFVELAFLPTFDYFSFHIGERGGDSGIWDAHLFVVPVGCFEESERKEESVALGTVSSEYFGRISFESSIGGLCGLACGRWRNGCSNVCC